MIVPRIRARSGNQCECMGECGLRHTMIEGRQLDLPPSLQVDQAPAMRCTAVNGEPHPVTKSKVVLTVGHLEHQPEDCRDEVLKHWCQRCHLRYDQAHHQKNARATRFRKAGQDDLGL